VRRARPPSRSSGSEADLLDLLPVLKRLRSRLNPLEVWIDTVGPGRVVGLLSGRFLTAGQLFGATLLALTFALALLL
jgi:hypothetical protein